MENNGPFGFDPEDFDRVAREAAEGVAEAFARLARDPVEILGIEAERPVVFHTQQCAPGLLSLSTCSRYATRETRTHKVARHTVSRPCGR